MNVQKFGLIFALILLVVSCDSDNAVYAINPSSADFGSVNLDEYTDLDIEITNKTKSPLLLVEVEIQDDYDFSIISGGTPPVEIAASATHAIKIRFAPTNAGVNNAKLIIRHNQSPEKIIVQLTGVGTAVAKIDMLEKQYDFGKVILNQTDTHIFEVFNNGSDILTLSQFDFTGAGAALYSIVSGGSVPVDIQPGVKTSFTVQFAPLSVASYPATLKIQHNAVNESSPVDILLQGEGVKFEPKITLSKSSPWDFGNVVSTTPSTEICEITNTGVDPLTIASATFVSGVDFSIEYLKDSNSSIVSFPHVIPVGLKAYLGVKFTPTATALLSDTLKIDHNGVNELSPMSVNLQGQGTLIVVKTYKYTGAVQQWTVPSGITSIDIEMYGAEGGASSGTSGTPGKGGKLTAKLTVQPGDVINIYVGGKGGTGVAGVGGAKGWNGGGLGGSYGSTRGGGGGGGASDIRKNGTTLADRILVAGGGGGGGHNTSAGEAGGHGGDLIGQTGATKYGGGGGTQTAGGAGGDAGSGRVAQPGALGIGGEAWTGSTGGGGGGGLYGGGGGSYEGGGGGSSYSDSSASSVVHTQGSRSGDGEIIISYLG